MNPYKNENYLKSEIMEYNIHQFIYGYDRAERNNFINNIVSDYPIKINGESPMAVYIKDWGLPVVDDLSKKDNISIICNEYLFFVIALNIVLNAKNNNDIDALNIKMSLLINRLNRNNNHKPMKNIDDLISALKDSKDYYKEMYYRCYEKDNIMESFDRLKIPFLQIQSFIRDMKNAINNDYHFGLIVDKHHDITNYSIKAVNGLINSRINTDISMKVFVEPDKWYCYIDSNGHFIEYIHDYAIVELDESYQNYLKRVKKRNKY